MWHNKHKIHLAVPPLPQGWGKVGSETCWGLKITVLCILYFTDLCVFFVFVGNILCVFEYSLQNLTALQDTRSLKETVLNLDWGAQFECFRKFRADGKYKLFGPKAFRGFRISDRFDIAFSEWSSKLKKTVLSLLIELMHHV